MQVGYVRSASSATILEATRRLEAAGCARTLIDAVDAGSAKSLTEPLKALISTLNPTDTLTVLRLDHLAPMPGLIAVLAELVDGGITVTALDDRFSTESAPVRSTLMALGRYVSAPQRDPHTRGRTRALNEKALERARGMIEEQGMSVVDVAAAMSVSRATIYRHLGSDRPLRRPSVPHRASQHAREAV